MTHWEVCEICETTVRMEGKVCIVCQQEVFRCLFCDRIMQKKRGHKICTKCCKENISICPVCLDKKPEIKKYSGACKKCLKLKIPHIYPEYVESTAVIRDNTSSKLELLEKIMEEMCMELRDVAIGLGVRRATVYGWLYDNRGIKVSRNSIEGLKKI